MTDAVLAGQSLPPFATHDDVAQWTGKTYDGAEQARLTLALEATSRSIRRECGWHVSPMRTADAVTVDGSGAGVQLLPTGHLVELIEVLNGGVPVPLEHVEWSRNGYMRLSGGWTNRLGGVRAIITHGHDPSAVPDLKLLTMQVALRGLQAAKFPGVTQISTGPFSATWDAPAMTGDELDRLAPFKIGG